MQREEPKSEAVGSAFLRLKKPLEKITLFRGTSLKAADSIMRDGMMFTAAKRGDFNIEGTYEDGGAFYTTTDIRVATEYARNVEVLRPGKGVEQDKIEGTGQTPALLKKDSAIWTPALVRLEFESDHVLQLDFADEPLTRSDLDKRAAWQEIVTYNRGGNLENSKKVPHLTSQSYHMIIGPVSEFRKDKTGETTAYKKTGDGDALQYAIMRSGVTRVKSVHVIPLPSNGGDETLPEKKEGGQRS